MKNGDMTSRERIDAVLRGDTPDRVPVFTAGHGITRHMLGVSYGEMVQSSRLMASCMLAWQDLIGDDRLMAYFDMMVEAAGFGMKMVFQDDQPAYSDKDDLLIKSPDDYFKLERYDVEKAERIAMTLEVAEILSTTRGDTVPVAAIVAESPDDGVIGICNYILHENTWELAPVCYLEDLFVKPQARAVGVGRALIDALVSRMQAEGWSRVYWNTKENNYRARGLYDKFTPRDPFVRYVIKRK